MSSRVDDADSSSLLIFLYEMCTFWRKEEGGTGEQHFSRMAHLEWGVKQTQAGMTRRVTADAAAAADIVLMRRIFLCWNF